MEVREEVKSTFLDMCKKTIDLYMYVHSYYLKGEYS